MLRLELSDTNVSDVRMQSVQKQTELIEMEITIRTGSCERDGDTCNHLYRFSGDLADNYGSVQSSW